MNAFSWRVWVWRRTTRRQPCRGFFLLVVAMFASTSCATQPGGSVDRQPVSPFLTPADSASGSIPLGPDPMMSDQDSVKPTTKPIVSEPTATESETQKIEHASAGKDPKQAKPRSDGRPAWWIESPQRDRGEVRVAAEALGIDLRSTRRAAIKAGLHLLAQELGGEPDEWVVQAVTIKPLRAVRAPDSVNKFVGYVLMTVPSRQ